MADTTLNDVYDDPDNILADSDDTVDGRVELPANENDDLSQSIFTPERGDDDRGPLDLTDSEAEDRPGLAADDNLDSQDLDANRLSDVITGDEQDGTNA